MSGDVSWSEDAPLHEIVNTYDTAVPAVIEACWFAELIVLGVAETETDAHPRRLTP